MIEEWEVNEEQIEECQMCVMNKCQFRKCYELSASSIFCNNNSDGFQDITTSKEPISASTFMSIHSTSEDVFVSTTTARYYDTDQSPLTNYTERMSSNFVLLCKRKKCDYILLRFFFLFLSFLNKFCIIPGASDQFALKVSLPVIMVIIIVPLCAFAVVFYLR